MSKADPFFSHFLLPLRKPWGHSSVFSKSHLTGLPAAGGADGRDAVAAWPGGLCLPRTAIRLALIGSIPVASGMSHGHVASELSTFSPRFCLSHPAFLSVSLSCRILVPLSLFISLFSLSLFFVYCLPSSLLLDRSLPQDIQHLGNYGSPYSACCLSSATCTTQWTKQAHSRGIPWPHSPLLKPLASSSLVVKLRRPKSSRLPPEVEVLAQRSELQEQDTRVAGPCAWQNGKT